MPPAQSLKPTRPPLQIVERQISIPNSISRSVSVNSTSTITSEVPSTPTTPYSPLSNGSDFGNMSNAELLQAEIRMRLANGPKKLAIPRTPDIPLKESATKEEVTEWLRAKGFKDDVVRRLAGLEGKTLLALKKSDLVKLLEGHVDQNQIWLLDSKLKIQRSSNPFNTGRTKEFEAVLRKARAKVEVVEEEESEASGESTTC